MHQPFRTRLFVLLASLLLVAGACGEKGGLSSDRGSLMVVATTTILGDVLSNIVRADAQVEVLLPIGADPHDYQLSSRQIALIQRADLVVANGLRFEEGILDVLAAAAADGANVFEVGDLLDPIALDDEGGVLDPHFWMDPARMVEAVDLIAQELTMLDPSVDWSARADSYAVGLLRVDEEVESILVAVPEQNRKLVTGHAVLGYFAQRYGFEVAGTIIPSGSTLAEPSSAGLAALVDTIVDANVSAIFVETIGSTVLAEAVAAEVGDQIVVVELFTGSLGPPGSGAESLISMLRINAQRVAEALR